MSEKSEKNLNQLTLFVGASPVRIYPSPDNGAAFRENGVGYGGSFIAFLKNYFRSMSLSKMSPVFSPLTKGKTWAYSSEVWPNSAMGGPTGCLMLNTSAWPSDASVCSLSAVLEIGAVPQKYFLSQRAAQGILRRAAKRGKVLPPLLAHSLQTLAGQTDPPETPMS